MDRVITSALLIFLVFYTTIEAQLPKNADVLWDANNPNDGVTRYDLIYDTLKYIVLPSACAPDPSNNNIQTCKQPITITTLGTHNLSLTATNEYGTSIPATVSFTVSVPGKSTNIRIRVN